MLQNAKCKYVFKTNSHCIFTNIINYNLWNLQSEVDLPQLLPYKLNVFLAVLHRLFRVF